MISNVAVLIFGGEGFDILRLALMAGIVGVLIDASSKYESKPSYKSNCEIPNERDSL